MAAHLNEYLNDKFGIEGQDIRTYSPLTLAYIGDAIFDVVVRSILVNKGNTAVNKLHKRASDIVKAGTQSAFIKALMDDPEEEKVEEGDFVIPESEEIGTSLKDLLKGITF